MGGDESRPVGVVRHGPPKTLDRPLRQAQGRRFDKRLEEVGLSPALRADGLFDPEGFCFWAPTRDAPYKRSGGRRGNVVLGTHKGRPYAGRRPRGVPGRGIRRVWCWKRAPTRDAPYKRSGGRRGNVVLGTHKGCPYGGGGHAGRPDGGSRRVWGRRGHPQGAPLRGRRLYAGRRPRGASGRGIGPLSGPLDRRLVSASWSFRVTVGLVSKRGRLAAGFPGRTPRVAGCRGCIR